MSIEVIIDAEMRKQLVQIAVDNGFGVEIDPGTRYEDDVLWFDGNPIPMMVQGIEAYVAKELGQ